MIPTPGLLRIHCAASLAHSRVGWLRCFERDRRLLVGARAAPVKTPNQALPTGRGFSSGSHRSLLFRFGAASATKALSILLPVKNAHQMSAVHDRQRSDALAAKLHAASPSGVPLVTSFTTI